MRWRNDQYLFYEELVPLSELDDLDVVDFGCGPGHDLVAIAEGSKPRRLIGLDVSQASLDEAAQRLRVHGAEVELILLSESDATIPMPDASIDFFLSSGVLHHIEAVDLTLKELARITRPGGRGRVMVYNSESIWRHLYVPYVRQLLEGIDTALELDQAFARSTDGAECPHSVSYRPDEFVERASESGFEAAYIGAAISAFELGLVHYRFDAIQDQRLGAEHAAFLRGLTFDEFGRPMAGGHVAGIDGFFELRRTGS